MAILNNRVVKIQLALFARDIPQLAGNTLDFASRFVRATGNIFDAPPTILPIPSSAPPAIPRIILASQDRKLSCNFARDRIDFFVFPNLEFNNAIIRNSYHQHIERIAHFLSSIDEPIYIKRIGYIITIEADYSDQGGAAAFIREHFTISEIFPDPHELTIQYIRRNDFLSATRSIETNVLVKLSQKGSGTSLQRNMLVVQFDINTIPEETTRNFVDQISDFGEEALNKISSIVDSFPAL